MLRYFKTIFTSEDRRPIRTTTQKVAILGRLYGIHIHEARRNCTTISETHVEVGLNPATRGNFANYINGWYRRKAREEFHRAMWMWLEEFERLDYIFPTPQLKIYGNMRRVWGRCYYTKGVITLNIKLYRLPVECLEYIVLHELTHMVAHDHGELFRAILDKIDPEWRLKEAQIRKLEQDKTILM